MSDGTGGLWINSGFTIYKFYKFGQVSHFLETQILYLENSWFGLESVQGPQPSVS
jgi:hypothetical protein